jgi:hypothetical protein
VTILYNAVNSSDYIVLNGIIIDEYWIGKDMEGSCHGLIRATFWHFPVRTWENYQKQTVGIAGCSGQDSS